MRGFFLISLITSLLAPKALATGCTTASNGSSLSSGSCFSLANGGISTTLTFFSQCETITNSSTHSIFIPVKTATEWTDFIAHAPTGVTLSACSSCTLQLSGQDSNITNTSCSSFGLNAGSAGQSCTASTLATANVPGWCWLVQGSSEALSCVCGTTNGVCGSSNGATGLNSAPSTNLCSSGTPTTVSTASQTVSFTSGILTLGGTGSGSCTLTGAQVAAGTGLRFQAGNTVTVQISYTMGTYSGSNSYTFAGPSTTAMSPTAGSVPNGYSPQLTYFNTGPTYSPPNGPMSGACPVGGGNFTPPSTTGSNVYTWTCQGSGGGSSQSCQATQN